MGCFFSLPEEKEYSQEKIRRKIIHYSNLLRLSDNVHSKLGYLNKVLEFQLGLTDPTEKEKNAIAQTYLQLASLYRAPAQQKENIEMAMMVYKSHPEVAAKHPESITRCHYLLANMHSLDIKEKDEHVHKVVEAYEQDNEAAKGHEAEVAMCYYYMGVFGEEEKTKVEHLNKALALFDADPVDETLPTVAQCHYYLASIIDDEKEILQHLDKALDLYNTDDSTRSTQKENVALCLRMRANASEDPELRKQDLLQAMHIYESDANLRPKHHQAMVISYELLYRLLEGEDRLEVVRKAVTIYENDQQLQVDKPDCYLSLLTILAGGTDEDRTRAMSNKIELYETTPSLTSNHLEDEALCHFWLGTHVKGSIGFHHMETALQLYSMTETSKRENAERIGLCHQWLGLSEFSGKQDAIDHLRQAIECFSSTAQLEEKNRDNISHCQVIRATRQRCEYTRS